MLIQMSDRDSSEGRAGSARDSVGEQPIEVRRHLDALRRARWFILAFVAAVTVTTVVVSLLMPERYRATATIVLEEPLSPFGGSDVETVQRRLETIQQLLGTNQVLDGAAASVPGETRDSIEDNVSSSVDNSSNIIRISAEADEPEKAAAIANAVAQTFLERQAATERERLAEARRQLESELNRLRAAGARPEEIEAVRQRISELTVSEVSAGSELELAQPAEPPDEPFSPRPIRNGLLAFSPRSSSPSSSPSAGPPRASRRQRPRAQPSAQPAGARRNSVRLPAFQPTAHEHAHRRRH